MLTVGTDAIDEFKARTLDKLRDLRCPVHRQPPRVRFDGLTLRDVRISMSACCPRLIQMANKAIASS